MDLFTCLYPGILLIALRSCSYPYKLFQKKKLNARFYFLELKFGFYTIARSLYRIYNNCSSHSK